jgi:O-Antigen ligase
VPGPNPTARPEDTVAEVDPDGFGERLGASRARWAILLLAIAGAGFLPGALDRFVFPKLALDAAGVALALSVPARGALPRAAKWLLVLAGLILLAAALSGITPLQQLIGRPPRYEGLVALPVYLGVLVSGARLLGPRRAPGSMAWMLDALSVAALAIGVEAALEAAGLRPLVSNVSRPGSLLGNASDQGAWAVLALGPLAAVAIRRRGALHRAGALGAAVALATSGSRGALVGAVVLALVLVALIPDRGPRIALVIGCAVLALGVLTLPTTRSRVLSSTHLSQQTVTGRRLLWSETLKLVGDHPLLGVGPSGYVDAIPAYHDHRYETEIGPANPPDSPHDWLLQAAAAGGPGLVLVALLLAGLVFIRGAKAALEQRANPDGVIFAGLLAGLAGYGVALLFYFTGPGTTPLAAVFAGALIAAPPPSLAGAYTRLRGGLVAGYTLLTVILVAAAVAEMPLRSALLQATAGNLAAADHDFHLAHDLRPWDAGIAQIATHAYAVLALEDQVGASRFGLPWAAKELDAYPDSIQALEDGATIESAAGRPAAGARLLRRARRLEPENPNLERGASPPA